MILGHPPCLSNPFHIFRDDQTPCFDVAIGGFFISVSVDYMGLGDLEGCILEELVPANAHFILVDFMGPTREST